MEITKGIWNVDVVNSNQVECNGVAIANALPVKEFRANAKLIAAAPELLEALKVMYELGDSPTSDIDIPKAYLMAEKAIEKATK